MGGGGGVGYPVPASFDKLDTPRRRRRRRDLRKPSLSALWAAFPDHSRYPTLRDLYLALGGQAAQNIERPGFGSTGNTCASRLSVAFNRGGAPITRASASAAYATTLGTADGGRIIFRVREFRNYLIQAFGKPATDSASPYDDSFRFKRGIIAFTVNWSDASGHIALFDRGVYREAHDNYATFSNGVAHTSKGEFWELP